MRRRTRRQSAIYFTYSLFTIHLLYARNSRAQRFPQFSLANYLFYNLDFVLGNPAGNLFECWVQVALI